jgi:hypothetical protein
MTSELIYFAKANPVLGDPLGQPVVPFAYAETVRRVDGRLRAMNVQTALPSWEEGELRLHSHRLPDRDFCGFAYRMPAPAWFVRSRPSDSP